MSEQSPARRRPSIGEALLAVANRVGYFVIERPCSAVEGWVGAHRIRESIAYWVWAYIALVIAPFAFMLFMEIKNHHYGVESAIVEWMIALVVALPVLAFFAMLFLIGEAKNQATGWSTRDDIARAEHAKQFDNTEIPNRDVGELFRNVHEFSFFNPSRIGHFEDLARADRKASLALFVSAVATGALIWLGHFAWLIPVVWAVVVPAIVAKVSVHSTFRTWRDDVQSIRRGAYALLQDGIRARANFPTTGQFSLDAYSRAVDKAMYTRIQVALGWLGRDMVFNSFSGIKE